MIRLKTKEEIEVLRAGGKILARIMDALCAIVRPGVTTGELEALACRLMAEAGGRPAQKDFEMGGGLVFPTALITCLNDEVVHAASLPSRTLKEGDILSIDFVMEYPLHDGKHDIPQNWPKNPRSALGGYYTDMSRTVPVGRIDEGKARLIKAVKEALQRGVAAVRPGNTLRDIGLAIQPYVESEGFSVIRDLVGHGVGHSLHEEPMVPNYIIEEGPANIRLEPGMVLAVEPMIAMGGYRVRESKHGFAYYMADRKPSAHYEHTVVVTEAGHDILTIR